MSATLWGQEASIPLSNIRQPSDDLILNGKRLTSEEAFNKREEVDLSRLEPLENAFYNGLVSTFPAVMIPKAINFQGILPSFSGLLRVSGLNGDQLVNLLMAKNLHTYLIRAKLLQKLGYQIPQIHYAKKIILRFESEEERDRFLHHHIPDNTLGAASRWLVSKSTKEVILQDVAILLPQESDHFNLALTPPAERLKSRTLRGLLPIYALTSLGESINKVPWTLGTISNQKLWLPHKTFSDFNADLHDYKWMMRKLAKLSRSDFEEVVAFSSYPIPVAKLIVEKLISRRNSLLKFIENEEFSDLNVNPDVSYGKDLVKGHLTREEFKGYASRFAHGDPDSPFKDFKYYFFHQFQSSVLDSLITRANRELQAFQINEQRVKFHKQQFNEGLNHFIETGNFKDFPVGAWVSPIVNGDLIISRDIVFGEFQGTDNLVQLADVFGARIELGAHVGLENFKYGAQVYARGTVSLLRTWSHLRPVKSLKASFKVPYKNMVVSLLKKDLQKNLNRLRQFEEKGQEVNNEERSAFLKGFLTDLNKTLGVGESLILTEKLTPKGLVSGGNSILKTRFSVATSSEIAMLRRVHIYRKDAKTIQVYDDRAKAKSLILSFNLDSYIPVLRAQTKRSKGVYKVKHYNANIDIDLEKNPNLYRTANALYTFLTDRSSELMEEVKRPYQIETNFIDKSSQFAFLMWRTKYLKTKGEFRLKTPSNQYYRFLRLTTESQSGISYEHLLRDTLNYYLDKWVDNDSYTVQLGFDRFKNPAQTLFGHGQTLEAFFETRLREKDNTIHDRDSVIILNHRYEGWSKKRKALANFMTDLNKRYQFHFYDKDVTFDFSQLMLYDLNMKTVIYPAGITNIKSLSKKTLKKIERQARHHNGRQCGQASRIHTPSQRIKCGDYSPLEKKLKRCQKTDHSIKKHQCWLELTRDLEKYLKFSDFVSIVGRRNIMMEGTIDGFRKDSEHLIETIRSNTFGEINGPYPLGIFHFLGEKTGMGAGELTGSFIRERL